MTQRRNIVKFGTIIPTQTEREAQSWVVNTYVERIPTNRSLNVKYQRNASFYGYFQALFQGIVVLSKPLTFEREQLFIFSNEIIQAEYNILCLLVDIGSSTGAFDETFALPFVAPRIPFDGFLFRLYNNTTITAELITQPYDDNCDAIDLTFEEPSKSANPNSDSASPDPSDPDFDLPTAPYNLPNDGGDTYTPIERRGTLRVTIRRLNPGDTFTFDYPNRFTEETTQSEVRQSTPGAFGLYSTFRSEYIDTNVTSNPGGYVILNRVFIP